jgi:hypothetical protein
VLVNICNRMMAKRPEERYQTAGEVSERLSEWLADRGLAVGESGKKKDNGGSGGIGSGAFRRFGAALSKAGADSGGGGVKIGVRKPAAAAPAVARTMTEEEMKLAPLDEEAPATPKFTTNGKVEKPASESDELSKIEIKPSKPKRSLIEEELDAERRALPPMPPAVQRREGDFNPLKPPGFTGPSYGTPTWVFVAIGVGVVAVIGVVLAVLMSAP